MRLLVCAGGTGGGVYPALAVVQERSKRQGDQLLWVGSENGMERTLIHHANLPYQEISAAGLHGVGWKKLPVNLFRLIKGTFQSMRILRQFKPDVIFFTGGYVAFPMALAGLHIPQVIFVPDIEPGLTLRVLSHVARLICVVNEQTKQFVPTRKRIAITGYPTRRALTAWNKDDARKALGLSENKPVLFIFGGSKGAQSINRAILANLDALLQMCQIVHVTGETDWEEVQRARSVLEGVNTHDYHITPYLHEEMGAAFRAADLVISRAGASTLGEFPLFGLPAILVPYPHAWRYQKVNAQYLADQGAAILMEDQLLAETLLPAVQDLMRNREKLTAMKEKMGTLAMPFAAATIGSLLEEMSQGKWT